MNKCQFYCNYIGNRARSAGGGGGSASWVWDPETAWQDIVDTCESNKGKEYTDTVTTFGEISGFNKWLGGVLADNGYIYSCKGGKSNILKLSYNDDSFSTALYNNGSESYGGTLATNKIIYYPYGNGISSVEPYFYFFNTTNEEIASFQPELTGTVNPPAFVGSVLAPNGYIYYIPSYSTVVIKVNPEDNSSVVFGELPTGQKWGGGALAPNGCIYGMPDSENHILKIDTSTDTATTFGSFSNLNHAWYGGVLAPNGCIYGIPYNSASILKIDTNNDTATTFGDLQGSKKWIGGVLAPNGCIYGIPYSSTSILKIDPGSSVNTNFQTNTLLSPYLNKF